MSRRSPTKSIIARRVRSIVMHALGGTVSRECVRITTSDYFFVQRGQPDRFRVLCQIRLPHTPETIIHVGVREDEHDAYAAGGYHYVIDRVAAEILRDAIPHIVKNAVARASRDVAHLLPHTRPASSSRRGAA